MNDEANNPADLCGKIARLVEERGWNQDEFARAANLNRLTVRNIFLQLPRRLHNATVAACARALGIGVYDLRELPLDALLRRMRVPAPSPQPVHHDKLARQFEEATQPELLAWVESDPERAGRLSASEWDELLSLQGTGGPLTSHGVMHFVELIERRRRLTEKVAVIAGTEYIDLLEQLVDLLHEKIQPYRNRK